MAASGLKCLSVHLDESGRKVIASFSPAEAVDAITSSDFKDAIDAAGFGGYSLRQAAIEQATQSYNSGQAFEIEVGEALDGKFAVRIDPNVMTAYLSCSLPEGGAPVQLQSVLDEAASRGISAELDLDAINRALLEGGDNIRIATGKTPVPGVDGRFDLLFPQIKERRPHLDEHGLADFRDLGGIFTVNPGDQLMRLIPPTEGEPGETVTGKPIPVKPGKKVSFPSKLEGAAIDENDPNLLVAAIAGTPVALKDAVKVEPVCTVQNVDLHTGNLSFNGTIHVVHDVHADMTLSATGDIYVDGTVENAVLEAGGDIVVKGGIIGVSDAETKPGQEPYSVIKCGGSCTARFVQKANIAAGNGIFIHDLAMLSELTAGHQIGRAHV